MINGNWIVKQRQVKDILIDLYSQRVNHFAKPTIICSSLSQNSTRLFTALISPTHDQVAHVSFVITLAFYEYEKNFLWA